MPATVTEFRLLRELVGRLGEVVSHDDLLKAGWPDVPDPDPLWLKPHLARLREKLVNAGAPIPVAVRGVGLPARGPPGRLSREPAVRGPALGPDPQPNSDQAAP